MIALSHVIKRFDSVESPVLTIDHLVIQQGEFCAIIGANGSGKSTLLKLIAQEYYPDQGSIIIKAAVSRVAQSIHKGTFEHLSVFENIVTSLIKKLKFSLYESYRAIVVEQLKTMGIGLERYIDQPIQHLSGGQRQLVATLMAFNSDAPIILLDEHTAALDHTMQKLLMQYTQHMIRKHNKTALMVTHSMSDAVMYANRLIMLDQGQVVWDIAGAQKESLDLPTLLYEFTQRAYAGL